MAISRPEPRSGLATAISPSRESSSMEVISPRYLPQGRQIARRTPWSLIWPGTRRLLDFNQLILARGFVLFVLFLVSSRAAASSSIRASAGLDHADARLAELRQNVLDLLRIDPLPKPATRLI